MFKKDLELEKRWNKLLLGIQELIGKKPADLNGVSISSRSSRIGSRT
jgi:hypothetical protein